MSLSIFLDRTFDKNRLKILVLWTFQHYGEERAWEISERLKNLGFRIATKAGFSIGIEDLLIPKEKRWGLRLTERKMRKSKLYEILGATTLFETEERLITGFRITSENLKEAILTIFQDEDSLNPLYIMSFSGARGNITQIQQLIGIRGLIIDPIGQVIKSPIRSNFKEGITLTEFLISCYGARKGIIDTALRTAKAGYLTRRLVDISHFQVVSIEDCNTRRRIRIFPLIDGSDRILFPLNERIRGRSLSYPIPKLGHRNLFLDFTLSKQIRKKYPFALFRSPLLCRAPFFSVLRQIQFNSKEYIKKKEKKKISCFLPWSIKNKNIYSTICQYCYGWNLADGNLVNIGEAVGILAAQSIGEPGTQLTIRTFHTGGVFSSGIFDRLHTSIYGKISFPSVIKGRLSRSRTGQIGFLTREKGSICIRTQLKKKENVKRKASRFSVTIRVKFKYIYKEHMEEEIILPKRILLLVRQGEWIGSKSNIAFLGITEFLCEDEVQIRTYRIPYRRELFFEDVSLNLLCSIIESQDLDLIPPEKLFFFLSLESYKKIRAVDSSRILLKSSELMGKDKNYSCPFLFSWKQGDLLSKNSSLTKIRVKKPVNYLIFMRVKDKKTMERLQFNSINGKRILLYKNVYLISTYKKNYRNLFYQNMKFPEVSFFTRRYKKNVFFPKQVSKGLETTKKFPIILKKRKKSKNLTLRLSLFFLDTKMGSNKFYKRSKVWFFTKPRLLIIFNKDKESRLSFEKKFKIIDFLFIVLCKKLLITTDPIRNIIFYLQFPMCQFNDNINCYFTNQNIVVFGLFLFYRTPSLRRKRRFILNKQECRWKSNSLSQMFYFLGKEKGNNPILNIKKNITFFFKRNSVLGTVRLYFKTSRKLLALKLFETKKKDYFSRYNWTIQIVKKQRQRTSRNNKNLIFFYFLTKIAAEIHQNISSKEFFFLTKNQLKRYVYLPTEKLHFSSFWQKKIIYIKEGVGTREIGERIILERDIVVLRQETRILLESKRFFPWKPGSILPFYTPLMVKRGRVSETRDITSGIPRIDRLLEIRRQTGLPFLLENLYKSFLKQGFPNGVANRKSLHFRQRVLIDRVQRIYKTNGVTLDDKHLELIVRPMAFTQVINDDGYENSLIQGEKHSLEVIERINYTRIVKNWKKKKYLHKWEPRIVYKPFLFGLTKGALHSKSFLSAASFQETSRILSRASIGGSIDFLKGLKENLILGTRLPIGTNARFFKSDLSLIINPVNEFSKIIKNKKNISILEVKKFLIWIDTSYYLELNQKGREN